MATYRVREGFVFGVSGLQHPATVVLTEAEAAGFLDKLELVEIVKKPARSVDVSTFTISGVFDAIANGLISAEDALAQERNGKRRTTLLTELETMIANGPDNG